MFKLTAKALACALSLSIAGMAQAADPIVIKFAHVVADHTPCATSNQQVQHLAGVWTAVTDVPHHKYRQVAEPEQQVFQQVGATVNVADYRSRAIDFEGVDIRGIRHVIVHIEGFNEEGKKEPSYFVGILRCVQKLVEI